MLQRRPLLIHSLAALGGALLPASLFAQRAEDRPPPPRRDGEAAPPGRRERADDRDRPPRDGPQRYSLEQAMSERAQLHTIAFNGLAFLTGDFAADTFLPPGKVSDYFGFQYLRDIDAGGAGHSTSFLTRIAFNLLGVLSDDQRARLVAAARAQQADVRRFAELRLPLIKAFRQNLAGELPPGSKGLDRVAVMRASADLYALDGQIAWERARVMSDVLGSLGEAQRARLARLKFGDSRTWPEAPEPPEQRRLPHDIDVGYMTLASEMFAWHAGSVDADTYFCPERHGMYFGGFGMKTAPAMGRKDYAISTSLTGDAGADFLNVLNDAQRARITALPPLQRPLLAEIATLRRRIATELRSLMSGQTARREQVILWSRRYGELDGEMSWQYATAFAEVGRSLTAAQRASLLSLRDANPGGPKGPFLYSEPLDPAVLGRMPATSAFFGSSL